MASVQTDTQTWRNILTAPDFPGIADIPSDDSAAIQPQYAHTVRLKGICQAIHGALDATPEIEALFRYVANPATAHGVFLDWLGDRVGVTRLLSFRDSTVRLEDEDFRFLIMLKALGNISGSSVETINDLLARLLSMPVWVVDNQDMTMDVHILGAIAPTRAAIFRAYGVPNRPAGVLAKIYVINPDDGLLGFQGSGLLPFNEGLFFQKTTIYDGGAE